jgi:uncharacterized Zn finger protein
MAARNKIYVICPVCNKTKTVPQHVLEEITGHVLSTEIVPCPKCEGRGYVLWGYWKEEEEA